MSREATVARELGMFAQNSISFSNGYKFLRMTLLSFRLQLVLVLNGSNLVQIYDINRKYYFQMCLINI